jgi:hypothetical protein
MHPDTKKEIDASFPEAVLPSIARAQEAFRRDLPDLLKIRSASQAWVAYTGDHRIASGKTKTELYQECLRRGLQRGEFIVRAVEPEVPHDFDLSREV